MRPIDALEQLGFNRKQAVVYLTLLQLGPATAYAVAERSGLKRPTVYVLLEELLREGAVHLVPHAKKRQFVAKNPEAFFQERFDRVAAIRESLPQFEALVPGARKPCVLYYDGLNGIRQALSYGLSELRDGEIRGFYAQGETATSELVEVFTWYNNRLKERNVRQYGVVPDHPGLRRYRATDTEFGRTMRLVPRGEYDATTCVEITDTFVRLVAFRDLQAVIVENADIATAFRQVFEMLWKRLETAKTPRTSAKRQSKRAEKERP